MRREYPQAPIPAVSAVIRDSKGRVLIVKRAREPSKGRWSIPGGVIKLGEDLKTALNREIQEECGLEVEIKRLLAVSDRIIRDAQGRVRYHYILIDYLCGLQGGELKVSSDISEARWVYPEELKDFKLTEGVSEVIRKGVKGNE